MSLTFKIFGANVAQTKNEIVSRTSTMVTLGDFVEAKAKLRLNVTQPLLTPAPFHSPRSFDWAQGLLYSPFDLERGGKSVAPDDLKETANAFDSIDS